MLVFDYCSSLRDLEHWLSSSALAILASLMLALTAQPAPWSERQGLEVGVPKRLTISPQSYVTGLGPTVSRAYLILYIPSSSFILCLSLSVFISEKSEKFLNSLVQSVFEKAILKGFLLCLHAYVYQKFLPNDNSQPGGWRPRASSFSFFRVMSPQLDAQSLDNGWFSCPLCIKF